MLWLSHWTLSQLTITSAQYYVTGKYPRYSSVMHCSGGYCLVMPDIHLIHFVYAVTEVNPQTCKLTLWLSPFLLQPQQQMFIGCSIIKPNTVNSPMCIFQNIAVTLFLFPDLHLDGNETVSDNQPRNCSTWLRTPWGVYMCTGTLLQHLMTQPPPCHWASRVNTQAPQLSYSSYKSTLECEKSSQSDGFNEPK